MLSSQSCRGNETFLTLFLVDVVGIDRGVGGGRGVFGAGKCRCRPGILFHFTGPFFLHSASVFWRPPFSGILPIFLDRFFQHRPPFHSASVWLPVGCHLSPLRVQFGLPPIFSASFFFIIYGRRSLAFYVSYFAK